MRHLEKLQMDSTISELDQKQDLFETLPEIKEEIPNFVLDESFMRNDFTSDDDSLIGTNINLNMKHDSDSSEDLYSPSKNEVRKNRRKASAPQRAVQLELSQSGSVGNSSESSQDNIDNLKFTSIQNLGVSLTLEGEVGLDFVEDDLGDDLLEDISEDDIFKDLQEEADGETIDEEIIDNVKEEWRAHWGVKCNMCEQVFPFKTEFEKHYISTYNLNPVYTCTFCNKSAEKYSTFRSHCYRHITEGRYKCQECPKGFSLQSMLHVHVLAKHTKAKPFMCEECGKSFVTKPGLKIHLKKHKTETKEDYPCVECGKVFAEKSHLARHYSFHSEERPYKCEVCQKMYKTERCLKVHSLVHAAARPFVCGYCNKGFLSSTKLKQHYNIHTGERPYKCKYCERTFTNYPNWLKHTRRRHKVDHKTGAELEPKTPKEEAPATPAAPLELVSVSETSTIDPLLSDVNLTKAEELLLQQGLLNFPLLDDKITFNQQLDFLTGFR
ncbi:hypothetical protein NQ314_006665 [Rhamnusium bicolor]|uniref:C2H2-type domain-containing protein n=1 Tax=Rhamnusium bicolor TaxID=1586634 RepID=A0AAV8YZL3_9CUCU|nr:hypothetical protein NQ314_006665 [Rhamnusium bicolor]